MIRKAFLIAFAALLLLSGCRPGITMRDGNPEITTWAGFFSSWWSGMNANYVFWDLDSPGNEWDTVYEETLPKMERYGVIGSSAASDKAAIRDLYDIVKTLKDGHYVLTISNGKGITGNFRPVYCRVMRNAGMTDDEIFEAQLTPSPETYSRLIEESDFHSENTAAIMERVFGIAGASGTAGLSRGFGPAEGGPAHYFSRAGYVKTPPGLMIGEESVGDFSLFVGMTDDDILYLGFSGFSLSAFVDDATQNGDDADAWSLRVYDLVKEYASIILDYENGKADLGGIIIDLRGNGGGDPMDFSLLWSPLLPEDLTVARIRIKTSDNRLSYSLWHDMEIEGRSANGSGKALKLPIAVLVNPRSVSCSEISTMAFMAMRDTYGADVRIIGGTTAGGNGPLAANEILNADTFQVGESRTRCAGIELRYIDGRSFEGIGIAPDIPVSFNYGSFMSGTDARLRVAFDSIRSRMY